MLRLVFMGGALALIASGVGGCSTRPNNASTAPSAATRSSGRSSVSELHLFGVPVTLNLDNRPGPDGFAVTLYATDGARDKGIPIKNGSIRLLMYDGVSGAPNNAPAVPRHTWTFSPEQLQAFEGKSAIGVGYRFALRWGDARPTRDRIVVVAHYITPEQRVVASQPSTIAVANK